MSSYIFHGHSYHLELNQLLSFKICFAVSVVEPLYMKGRVSVCLYRITDYKEAFTPTPPSCTLPLIFPCHHTSHPLFHLPLVHMLSIFADLLLPHLSPLHHYLLCLFNSSFIPFKMTRNVRTHCAIALALLLPGNIVFLLPKYTIKMEKDVEFRESDKE